MTQVYEHMQRELHISLVYVCTLTYLLDLSVLALVWPSNPELWHADAYLTSHQVCSVRKKTVRFINMEINTNRIPQSLRII